MNRYEVEVRKGVNENRELIENLETVTEAARLCLACDVSLL
jgi:hypothetical protein